jgi:predicted P-loop ATPase/GTPase
MEIYRPLVWILATAAALLVATNLYFHTLGRAVELDLVFHRDQMKIDGEKKQVEQPVLADLAQLLLTNDPIRTCVNASGYSLQPHIADKPVPWTLP